MTRTPKLKANSSEFGRKVIVVAANLACGLWISLCIAYIAQSVGLKNLLTVSPPQLGVLLLGLASVPGIIWITLGHFTGLRALDRANRIMVRHFRDFTRFSAAEREEISQSSEAARRESLSLFEAAQASLAALGQIQGSLKQNTLALIDAAGQSTEQIGVAGQDMERRALAVRDLTGQFHANSTELQKRAGDAVTAIEAVLKRMETSQGALGERTQQLDAAADRTVSRLHLSGEAIHVTLSSLADAASLLESRRDQIQRTTGDVTAKLETAGDRIADELKSIENTASSTADAIVTAARQASDQLAENATLLDDHAEDLRQANADLSETLRKDAAALAKVASQSAEQIDAAGKAMEQRAETVRDLSGQFLTRADELQKHADEAATAIETVLGRMDASQTALVGRASQLDVVTDRTLSRLDVGGAAIHAAASSLTQSAALLEARRDQIQSVASEASTKLKDAGSRVAEDLKSIENTASSAATTIIGTVKEASGRFAENAAALQSNAQTLKQAGDQLAGNSRALAEASQGHIGALRAAASVVAENADSVARGFSGQIGDITSLSNDAAMRLEQAASRIHAGLDGIRHNIDQTSGSIDQFTEIGDRLHRYRHEAEENLAAMLGRLDQLAARFRGEVGNAGEVERAIAQVGAAVGDALARIRSEQDSTWHALDAFGERSGSLSQRLEGLRTIAVSGASDITAAADRLHHRSEVLTDELKGQALALNDTMNRAETIAGVVSATGTMLDQTVAAAGDASRAIRGEFSAASQDIQEQRGRMQQEAAAAVETMAQAKARMEESIAQITAILGNLDGKASDINFNVSSSLSRITELTHGLERARDEVTGSSDRAAERINSATGNLYASADRIREAADHAHGAANHAAEMGHQLAGRGHELRDRVAEITHSAQEASDRLQASTEGLAHSATRTKEQLGQIAQDVRHENEAIIATLGRIATVEAALRGAGAMVDEIVSNAEKAAATARDEMHSVGRAIALQAKVMVETSGSNGAILDRTRSEMESVVTHVQDAFGSLNQKAGEINFVVSTAVNRLGELSRGLESARASIDGTTSGASEKMSQMAEAMRSEFGGVHEIANRALEQLERTLVSIAGASANLDMESQTIEQRIAASLRAAETGGLQFSEKIGATLAQVGKAEQALLESQERLNAAAEGSTAHFLRLVSSLATGGSELGNAAVVSGERIIGASEIVESRLQSISAIADQVRSAIGAFATDLNAASDQTATFTQTLTDRSNVLRDNITQVARTAGEVTQAVKATTDELVSTTIEISDAAGRTRTEIARTTAELRREGTAIAETEAESRALAAQVAALLGERAMELAQTARQVAAETVTMRDTNAKYQRELFLSAANTVLHALTSLSVDISRVLDTDLPEELRMELVRGDIPNFVRRLSKLRDTVSTPKLRAKFATDTRFRSHVQAYLSQFEQLLSQAKNVDQGAVLSATLVSSDIGKIYTFLAAAISTDHDELQQTG